MKKNDKRAYAILAIIFVAYSVIAFAIPWAKNGVFWLSYLFSVLAIGVQVYVLKIAFRGGVDNSARSKFYGFPIAKIGVTYGVIQLLLGIIFMALNNAAVKGFERKIPLWIPIIIYVVALAIAAIGFISTDAMRDEIERQDVKHAAVTSCMDSLKSIVYPLASQVEDDEVKKALSDLSDEFKYSDPVSSPAIKTIEDELESLVNEMQKAVLDEDMDSVKALIKKVRGVLVERNRVCKLSK